MSGKVTLKSLRALERWTIVEVSWVDICEDNTGDPLSFTKDMKVVTGATHCEIAESALANKDTVLLKGLMKNEVVFRPNDRLSINQNLYSVMNDARSDENGFARVKIAPRLWQGVAKGDLVNLRCATGLFVLTDPNSGTMNFSVSGLSTGEIEAVGLPWLY